jgi:hypothetical protein
LDFVGNNFDVIGIRGINVLCGKSKTKIIYGTRNLNFCVGNFRRNIGAGVNDVVYFQTKEEIIILWFQENKGRI